MDTESRFRLCEAARVRGELTVQETWLRYLALGGNRDAFEIDGYLQGLLPLEKFEEHVLAVALNERLDEIHRLALIPLPIPTPPAAASPGADGDAVRAVLDGLLGWDSAGRRPPDPAG
jgi:hypothetical protein